MKKRITKTIYKTYNLFSKNKIPKTNKAIPSKIKNYNKYSQIMIKNPIMTTKIHNNLL